MSKSSGNNKLKYVRNIPKFLNKYKNILETNKKNYLNEELEYEKEEGVVYQTEEEIRNDGAIIVHKKKKEEEEEEEEDFNHSNFQLLEVPKMSDLIPEEVKETKEEEREIDYYKDGKILFHNNKGNKKRDSETEVTELPNHNKTKKQKQKTKNLLSFDEEN